MQNNGQPLYTGVVGEAKSSISSESIPDTVTQVLVHLSLYLFLAQIEYPSVEVKLTGFIFTTRSVGKLDKLQKQVNQFVADKGASILKLPPSAKVNVEILLIDGQKKQNNEL